MGASGGEMQGEASTEQGSQVEPGAVQQDFEGKQAGLGKQRWTPQEALQNMQCMKKSGRAALPACHYGGARGAKVLPQVSYRKGQVWQVAANQQPNRLAVARA